VTGCLHLDFLLSIWSEGVAYYLSASAPLPYGDEHSPLPTARRTSASSSSPKLLVLFGILFPKTSTRDTTLPPAHHGPLQTTRLCTLNTRRFGFPNVGCSPKKCLNGRNKDCYCVSVSRRHVSVSSPCTNHLYLVLQHALGAGTRFCAASRPC
jgi:hypothetical protein